MLVETQRRRGMLQDVTNKTLHDNARNFSEDQEWVIGSEFVSFIETLGFVIVFGFIVAAGFFGLFQGNTMDTVTLHPVAITK